MTIEEALFGYFERSWELSLLASGFWSEIVTGERGILLACFHIVDQHYNFH